MAHEITSSDNVIMHRIGGWHGMGIVVADAPTPVEALQRIEGDWTVQRQPLYRRVKSNTMIGFTEYVEIPSHFMNVRSDNGEELGIVGKDWQAWQNLEVAEFAERLAKEGDIVKIETAGTIRGGRKIWFLLKGECFSVRRAKDVVHPYICVSNGHDGVTGLRCDNTTVRVVCSNTLHMVIPDGRSGFKTAGYSCSHRGDLAAKVEEAREALRLYEHAVKQNVTMYDALAGRQVGQADVDRFLTEVYARAVENFPLNPTTEAGEKKREKALNFIARCVANFEANSVEYGANAWILLNSFTETSQARRKSAETKASAKLFGVDAARGMKALEMAMNMAV